jgi:hypothetical protein
METEAETSNRDPGESEFGSPLICPRLESGKNEYLDEVSHSSTTEREDY